MAMVRAWPAAATTHSSFHHCRLRTLPSTSTTYSTETNGLQPLHSKQIPSTTLSTAGAPEVWEDKGARTMAMVRAWPAAATTHSSFHHCRHRTLPSTTTTRVWATLDCTPHHQREAPGEPADHAPTPLPLGRRQALVLPVSLGCILLNQPASQAQAGGLFSKYIKRKKLDPLETYLPTILLSQLQFQQIEEQLVATEPNYEEARSLLRSGPASSLRADIRAVAQYADDAGDGQTAGAAVDACLRAIEELDSYLLRASRKETPALDIMRQRVTKAVTSLDSLLATVPAAILDKGKSVAFYYRDLDENGPTLEEPSTESNLLRTLPSGL